MNVPSTSVVLKDKKNQPLCCMELQIYLVLPRFLPILEFIGEEYKPPLTEYWRESINHWTFDSLWDDMNTTKACWMFKSCLESINPLRVHDRWH